MNDWQIGALAVAFLALVLAVKLWPRKIDYNTYMRSPAWKLKRAACIRRARGRCQECGRKEKHLHAHHLTYERLGHEKKDDLIALCSSCHAKRHMGKQWS